MDDDDDIDWTAIDTVVAAAKTGAPAAATPSADDAFDRWFPAASKQTFEGPPRLRLICFPRCDTTLRSPRRPRVEKTARPVSRID